MIDPPARGPGGRPPGVAVIAIFLVLNAALAVLVASVESEHWTSTATLREVSQLTPGAILLLAALDVVAAVGLWRGSRGAWVLTMVLVGVSLVGSLYLYLLGDPAYLRLAIDVIIVFYLNQGAVRDYFGGLTGQPLPASAPRSPGPSTRAPSASSPGAGAPGQGSSDG